MFEKLNLVELNVDDARIGGDSDPDDHTDEHAAESTDADDATESAGGIDDAESDADGRRSIPGRIGRLAVVGVVLGVGAMVARRVRGRGRDESDDVESETEIGLESEDGVEQTA